MTLCWEAPTPNSPSSSQTSNWEVWVWFWSGGVQEWPFPSSREVSRCFCTAVSSFIHQRGSEQSRGAKIPGWLIPKPIWIVCEWEGRRDLVPPARSGTPERLGRRIYANQLRKGTTILDVSPYLKKKAKKKKIPDPFEVCPLLRIASILKCIPDHWARKSWIISKKKESQPSKKYTPRQCIASSLI